MVASRENYRIIIKPKAIADIEEIWSYIVKDSRQNADGVARRLLEFVESLSLFPNRCKIHEHRLNPKLTVRAMSVPPYLIYYRVDEINRAVTVLTIRHGARRQPKRFRP